MNWSLRDTIFTGRSFRDYDVPLVWERKISYSLVSCLGRGDARVAAPSRTWGVDGFWSVLWCAESSQGWGVFFTLVQVRLSDIKKISWHCNNLTLELYIYVWYSLLKDYRSSYRKLAWMGFEPTTTEFRSEYIFYILKNLWLWLSHAFFSF